MDKTKLKYAVQNTGSYFFDRSNMKFFGDTMRNYYVTRAPVKVTTSEDTHMCWELRRIRPVKHGLTLSAYFDVDTFKRILPANE